MGASALPIIGEGISAGAGLLGAGKASSAQSQDNAAAAGLYSAEEKAIQQLLGNYFAMAPKIESGLLNFPKMARRQDQGLIQELANTMGSSDQSLIQSFRGNLGGVANPGAVLGGLARTNAQNEGQAVQGMSANMDQILGGQELDALNMLSSFVSGPVSSALGGLQNIGNVYASEGASMGNPWTGALGNLGTFLSSLGQNSSSTTPNTGPLNTGYIPPPGLISPSYDPWLSSPSIGTLMPGANTNPYAATGPQP